jgi:hypothetical protein
VDMKFEVAVIPVSDVDRGMDFYKGPGWRLDAGFATGPVFRAVQLTPPGSACPVIFGHADPDWPDWYAQYMADESAGETRGENT